MGYIKEIGIAAPIQRVWTAWTSRAETERWLAPRANIAFKEGGVYEFFWDENPEKDSTLGCKLLAIKPKQLLRFQWQGKTEFLPMFQDPLGPTEVEVRFSAGEGKTRVIVEQTEIRSLPDWKAYEEWMASAWEYALGQLKAYCEELPANSEETI